MFSHHHKEHGQHFHEKIFQVELHTAQAINIELVGASKQCQKSKVICIKTNYVQTFCRTATRLIQVSTLNTSTWY
jgi:hypothetical protein